MKLHFAIMVAIASIAFVAFCGGGAYGITWEVGLKGGITNARLTGDAITLWIGEEEDELAGAIDGYKLGFVGGGYARADFSDLFGIQAEILYKQKGGEGPAAGTAVVRPPNSVPLESTFDGTLTLQIDYIEVPVLATFTFKPDKDGRLSLRGLVGPTFSYCASAEVRLEGQAHNPTLPLDDQNFLVDETKDADAWIEDIEVGALIGVSVSYAFSGMEMFLDARWGRGLTTIDNTTNDRSSYNSAVDFMAGFEIPLGSR